MCALTQASPQSCTFTLPFSSDWMKSTLLQSRHVEQMNTEVCSQDCFHLFHCPLRYLRHDIQCTLPLTYSRGGTSANWKIKLFRRTLKIFEQILCVDWWLLNFSWCLTCAAVQSITIRSLFPRLHTLRISFLTPNVCHDALYVILTHAELIVID